MSDLRDVIKGEREALENLLKLLDEQYEYIMKKKVIELEGLVDKIKNANKDIALAEVNRRKLVGNESMKDLVNQYADEKLDLEYRNIKKLLEAIKLQKETNELLIRQQMSFNNQMLNIINPKRENKTYNSYGNLRK